MYLSEICVPCIVVKWVNEVDHPKTLRFDVRFETQTETSGNKVIHCGTDNGLTSEQRALLDINSELAKLQQKYNTVIKNRDEMKQQLEREIKEQQRTQWELQHQSRRTNSYEQLISKAQMEIATLKSYIPMVGESTFVCPESF